MRPRSPASAERRCSTARRSADCTTSGIARVAADAGVSSDSAAHGARRETWFAADLDEAPTEFFRAWTLPRVDHPRDASVRHGSIGAANANGALELVARLKDLLPQIERQLMVRREKRVDCSQRLGVLLAADECAEPRAEEEDAPVLLNPRQGVERRAEVRAA